ncbi:MAG: TatD family deoxyribonuclease [Pseudobutyrivibrio sp.]|nr:TatD family deoxyribonuclease [Pseudobutyrivibrio sp.]
MIFESHAHYDDRQFDVDRETLLENLPFQNVGVIVNVGSDIRSSKESITLAHQYDYIYAAIGVHPDEVDTMKEADMEELSHMAKEDKVVAIGEIGLDYFRKEGNAYKSVQKEWFCRQLDLAKEIEKPVIIHSRDAAEDTIQILRDFRKENPQIENPGVIHCYSYSPELAKEYVAMGFYIGIGGVVTFKNAKKLVETVAQIPLERILVETDSPYLCPEPNRGKRNDSSQIRYVMDRIADIRGIAPEEVEKQTEMNARKMYRLS